MQKTCKQLFFLLFIFAVPVISSWFLFHYHEHFRLKTLNHGTLLKSPIDVNYLSEQNAQKKWRVLYVSNETCDSACKQITHQLNQVQKALGKDSHRVFILFMNNKEALLKKLQTDFMQHEKNFVINNKIYLIDPLGNLFMYYSDTTDPMSILKDLKRVLEVSQIG
ncbi:MAG TPA: hypothetical protein VLI69_03640 [Gammaproteobacteria bacterium]|nr:hypothetical protein [Gammaproteobacteria bacterium]